MNTKTVYLMRGLPSCGKSHTAARLVDEARRWTFAKFTRAVDEGTSPIVIDSNNGRSTRAQRYARYAVEHGYTVELCEPESDWWQEIRVLLKYKKQTKEILYDWADRLAAKNRSSHRVSAANIRRRINKWIHGITVEDILNYRPAVAQKASIHASAARSGVVDRNSVKVNLAK